MRDCVRFVYLENITQELRFWLTISSILKLVSSFNF